MLPYSDALLPPLWQLAASYLDCAERWFYAEVVPHLPPQKDLDTDGYDCFAIIEAVISGNHIHMLSSLGMRFGSGDVSEAARGDRVEMMARLFEMNPKIVLGHYERRPLTATVAGAVNVLIWENETKICPWDTNTCRNLATGNHFDALRRLHECSAPWDRETYVAAVGSGNVEMVGWIREVDPSITDAAIIAQIKTVPMLEHFIDLHRARSTLMIFVQSVAKRCPIHLLRFMLETRMFDGYNIDSVVAWVSRVTGSLERTKLAVDCGYPLPPPTYYDWNVLALEILVEVGWRPA